MTTIAVKAGVMAADTQLTCGNYAFRVQKLFRLPDGGVAAGAGTWASAYVGLRWLAGGEVGDAPDIEGCTIVILRPDGGIWFADETFPAYPLLDDEVALGCGRDLARVCLTQGMSALEAVAHACELDLLSSDPIQSMSIATPEPLPGVDTHKVTRRKRK